MPKAHLRIDEGVKRGKRKSGNYLPKAALSGQFASAFSQTQRLAILDDCYKSMQAGESTEAIAARNGIPRRTLQHWLLDDPKADEARRILINGELARTLDEMRKPENESEDTPLRLARAREEFRAWSWIAERRESRIYGQTQQISVKTEPLTDRDVGLLTDAQELLALFKSRQEKVVLPLLEERGVDDTNSLK